MKVFKSVVDNDKVFVVGNKFLSQMEITAVFKS